MQRHLAQRGFPATAVCAGRRRSARARDGRDLRRRGATRDAHEPAVRAALAGGLAERSRSPPRWSHRRVPAGILLGAPPGALCRRRTRGSSTSRAAAGAEWIDAVGGRRALPGGPRGRGGHRHGDWRAEHVRFGRLIVAAFDWDACAARPSLRSSLHRHAFCADWTRRDRRARAPSTRRAPSSPPTRRPAAMRRRAEIGCARGLAYSCAYTRAVAGRRRRRSRAAGPARRAGAQRREWSTSPTGPCVAPRSYLLGHGLSERSRSLEGHSPRDLTARSTATPSATCASSAPASPAERRVRALGGGRR